MPSAKITLADCTISANAPLADMYALLALRGGIVVQGLFPREEALKMKAEFKPHMDARAEMDKKSAYTGAFFPTTTVKIGGLISRSDTYARKMVPHTVFHELAKEVLMRRDQMPLAPGGAMRWTTAMPQVNVTSVLEIHPGAAAQTLHRDDMYYHPHRPATDAWDRSREMSMLCFVALDKVTARNGGTLFVPGTHLMADSDPMPSVEEAISVEGDVGDSMLSSLYHAGGGNVCEEGEPDSVRAMVACGYTIGYMRQEENQYLANDIKVIKKLPIEVQSLAGWAVSLPMSDWLKVQRKRLLLLLPLLLITFTLSLLYKSFGASILRTATHSPAPASLAAAFSTSRATSFAPSPTPLAKAKMSVKSVVEQIIKDNHVVVFSKSYCPYCTKTKNLLKSLGETASVHELDNMDEGSDWQAYLADKTGQRTVPQIFIDGAFIGGNSDLEGKNRSGELKKILAASA
ncbi:hypothetical protein RQP46_008029 [Phenoliferia psychrophenolica]